MEVVVSTPDGKDLRTLIQPTAAIGSIRSLLGLAADLLLVCDGQVMDENKDFASYGLEQGGELTALAPGQEQVTISTLKGKTFLLIVARTDSIANVKSQIQRIANYKRDRQKLVAGGQILENSGSVGAYGLVTGMKINLLMPDDVLVWVAGQAYCLAKDQDTVIALKEQIQARDHSPVEQQVLTIDNRELNDAEHLSFLHTSPDHSIHLQLAGGLSVTVRQSHQTVVVPIPSLQITIRELKQLIEPNCPPEKLALFLANQELVNHLTLEDSCIGKDAELVLVLPSDHYVVIKPLAAPVFLEFTPINRTIKSLRRKIEAHRSLPLPIRLFYGDQELLDQISFENYSIQSEEEILLVSADQCVFTIKRAGFDAPIRLYFPQKQVLLLELQEQIEQVLGIPVAEQVLSANCAFLSGNGPVTKDVIELHTDEDKRIYRGLGTNDSTMRVLTVRKSKRTSMFSGKTLQDLKIASKSERIYAGSTLLTCDEKLLADLGLSNMQEVSALQSDEELVPVQVGCMHEVSVIAEPGIRASALKYLLQRDWNFPLSACRLYSASRELGNAEVVEDFTNLELQGSTGLCHISLPRKLRPKRPRVKRSRKNTRPMRGRRRVNTRVYPTISEEAKKPVLLVIARTSGHLFRLRMREDSSLMALKAAISCITGLEISEQRLFSKGKILKDRRSLRFNNVGNLDLVYVLSASDILVKAKVSEVIQEIPMKCSATVLDLKKAVVGSLASSYSVLGYEKAREDETQIGEICLTNQLFVRLVPNSQAAQSQPTSDVIVIRGIKGKLRVKAKPTQSVADLKTVLSKRYHVSPAFCMHLEGRLLGPGESLESLLGKTIDIGLSKQLSVIVHPPQGPVLTLWLNPNASVNCLKAAIKKQEGYHFSSMSVLHHHKSLPNQQKLSSLETQEFDLELTDTFQIGVGVLTLEVHARYTVAIVKDMCGGDNSGVGLVFMGAEMEDRRRLEDYKVGPGTKLELLLLDQFIDIKMTWKTVSFAIKVLPTVKVETIQSIITRKTGLKPAEQRLYLDHHLLKRGKVLADYTPSAAPCNVNICSSSEVRLTYKGCSGRVEVIMNAVDKVEKLRRTIQRMETLQELPLLMQECRVLQDTEMLREINPKRMLEIVGKDLFRLNVQWSKRLLLAVEPSTTISSLRTLLVGMTGGKELLIFYSKQLLTEESAIVQDILKGQSIDLRLLPRYVPLAIQQTNKTTEITVALDSSVQQLKTTIFTQLGIPISKQQLLFRDIALSGSRPLYHYDFPSNPLLTLHVRKSITLLVQKQFQQEEPLEVDPEETIQTIITSEDTQVWYKGQQLLVSSTFAQAGVRTGDLLTLSYIRSIGCQVMHAGQTTTVILPEETRVAVLKEKIAQMLNVPVKDQLLVMDTYALSDSHPVRVDMENSTIELITPEYRPWLIAHRTGAVTVITFAEAEGKKVLNVKKELAKRWSVAVEKQVLLQGEEELEDDTVLSSLQSRHMFFVEQSQTVVVVQGSKLVVPLEAKVEGVLYGVMQGEHTAVDYHLSYKGKVLPESWTMAQAKVKTGATLDLLTTEEITVQVLIGEKEQRVTMRKDDPVSMLLTELDGTGVLLWQWEELEEELSLFAQGVYSGATLHLHPSDTFILLKLDSYEGELEAKVLPTTPICALKKQLQRKYGIDISRQRLFLASRGIEASSSCSVISFLGEPERGKFLTPNDELLQLQAGSSLQTLIVKYSDTVGALKARLQCWCPGLEIKMGLETQDEARLCAVGIGTGVTLSLDEQGVVTVIKPVKLPAVKDQIPPPTPTFARGQGRPMRGRRSRCP